VTSSGGAALFDTSLESSASTARGCSPDSGVRWRARPIWPSPQPRRQCSLALWPLRPSPSRSSTFLIGPSSGSFAPLVGTLGFADDVVLASVPDSCLNFIASPVLTGELTSVPGGVFSSVECFAGPATGQTCTVPSSPYMFANVAGGRIVVRDMRGDFSDGVDETPSVGLLAFPFAGRSHQNLLDVLFAEEDSVAALRSASFTTAFDGSPVPVPQPTAWFLLGAGALAAIAVPLRRM